MQISVTLLLCVFILCCTGFVRGFAKRIRVPRGQIAALCLLAAALSSFDVSIAPRLTCNVAFLLIAAASLALCIHGQDALVAALLALLCGILGWFMQRLFPTFVEPGLMLALPSVLLSIVLPLEPRQKMLCQALSPLFYGLTTTLEEWYLFDIATFSIGNAQQLDAQVLGMALLGTLAGIPLGSMKKTPDVQNEY